MSLLTNVAKKLFGTKSAREVKRMGPLLARIDALEPQMQALEDDAFPGKIGEYKERLAKGESLDDLLPETFALVREASVRTTGMRHYPVQMVGGIVLHQGKIGEMKTGEGKTLVATLPCVLNALEGKGVHLVTVNDYLAKRDAEWMGKIYNFLGLSVGVITHDLVKSKRQINYRCDITYGTNNEFGFDYLRDNMEYDPDRLVQRPLNYCIIDEVDSILVDEARTPLIISGPKEDSTEMYRKVDAIMPKLSKGRHYTVDEKARTALLSDEGVERVQDLLNTPNLFDPKNVLLLHHVQQALLAHSVYKKDVHYLIQGGQVLIIDEFTGRALPGRRWSDGLHQAVEAKEKVRIENESETLASISFQNYFRLYNKMSGMTGTAETEAAEFHKTYKLDVVVIPTNKPIARIDNEDVVYRTEREKFEAIIEDVKDRHENGQPVLVGTISIEKSEILHKMLSRAEIPHNVLNAKHHEREAEIVAQAGRKGAVTIATNMAGRGTDIILGGNPEPFVSDIIEQRGGNPKSLEASMFIREVLRGDANKAKKIGKKLGDFKDDDFKKMAKKRAEWEKENAAVLEAGGFYIMGTERHDSRRIDNQLRGRSGRQGDPGESRFYLSLEDDLMRRFGSERLGVFMERMGMEYGETIEHSFVTSAIESAQKKVEAHNFEIRKNMLEYDDVMNIQRKTIYSLRHEILDNSMDLRVKFEEMMEDVIELLIDQHCPPRTPVEEWDLDALEDAARAVFNIDIEIDEDALMNAHDPGDSAFEQIFDAAEQNYNKREEQVGANDMRKLESEVYLYEIDEHWKAHLTAIDHLREGIGLQGYRQIDPKLVYKKEAFQMFEALLVKIKTAALTLLFNMDVGDQEDYDDIFDRRNNEQEMHLHHGSVDEDDYESQEPAVPVTVRREKPKLGRNQPCWCGSGKKYKKCHLQQDLDEMKQGEGNQLRG
ncbi:MAG: preprotein translocase subunit SecA [Deltaproteobacteria bacterium]|nr:MAG: preprotein translocase subunit SecA [Deltaproteobacteria bacterium]